MKFSLVLALVFMLLISTVISYEFEDYTALSSEYTLRDESVTLANVHSEEESDASVFSEHYAMESSKPLSFESLESEQALQQNGERGSGSTENTESHKTLSNESEDILSYHSETPLVLTS
eukprot:gene5449-9262_t